MQRHCGIQGLESWSTSPQYREFFRQRVWGGVQMVSQVMFNREKVSLSQSLVRCL